MSMVTPILLATPCKAHTVIESVLSAPQILCSAPETVPKGRSSVDARLDLVSNGLAPQDLSFAGSALELVHTVGYLCCGPVKPSWRSLC